VPGTIRPRDNTLDRKPLKRGPHINGYGRYHYSYTALALDQPSEIVWSNTVPQGVVLPAILRLPAMCEC